VEIDRSETEEQRELEEELIGTGGVNIDPYLFYEMEKNILME